MDIHVKNVDIELLRTQRQLLEIIVKKYEDADPLVGLLNLLDAMVDTAESKPQY